MNVAATADSAPRLSGRGEVVLHNLKNWFGYRAAQAKPLSEEEASLISDTLQRFFDQAERIVRHAVRLGELAPDESERLDLLLKTPRQHLDDIKEANSGHALERLAAFLADQYNRGGMLSRAIQGETFEMDDSGPLSLVERALVTVVRVLAPLPLLVKGALRFRRVSNERVLIIDDGAGGSPCAMGISIGAWYDVPIRLSRVKTEAIREGGEWQVASGEWQVASGEWRVAREAMREQR